ASTAHGTVARRALPARRPRADRRRRGLAVPGRAAARRAPARDPLMGLGTSRGVALVGMTGHVVGVEAHLAATVPGFTLIGLPDASLSESRDRVRAAVASSGLAWPQQRVTVNLSPASLPKHGAGFDLAIAVAVLAGARLVDATAPRGVVHLGELG